MLTVSPIAGIPYASTQGHVGASTTCGPELCKLCFREDMGRPIATTLLSRPVRVQHIQNVEITSGKLVVAHVDGLFPYRESHPHIGMPAGTAYFEDFVSVGRYRAYFNGRTLVIDTAPRVFQARKRAEFRQLEGTVPIASRTLGR